MLTTILDSIKTRLETIPDITVLYDVRQAEKKKSPIAIIGLPSENPEGDNWKHSSKYKAKLNVVIELVHTSLPDLLTLIESAESVLKLTDKLPGTIEWGYTGWSRSEPPIGSNTYGAQIEMSVVYVKTTA